MKPDDRSTGRSGENGTMAWMKLPPVARPRQEPNYDFFRGVAVACGITAFVVLMVAVVFGWI